MSSKFQTRMISPTLAQIGGIGALQGRPREQKAFLLAKINFEKGKLASAQAAAKIVIKSDMEIGFYLKAAALARECGLGKLAKEAAHLAVEVDMEQGHYARAMEIAEEFGIVDKVPLLKDLKDLLSY